MKKRTIIYIGVLVLVLFGGLMGRDPISGLINAYITPLDFTFAPVRPFIQLPGEVWLRWPEGSFLDGPFSYGLTNTFTSAFLAFLVILFIAWRVKPRSRTADEVPTGFYNFFEMIYEGAFNYVERSAGKWTKNFFPFFMTFVLWILLANWMSLLPGWDSIGIWENVPHFEAEKAEKAALDRGATEEEAHHIFEDVEHAVEEANNQALRVPTIIPGIEFLMSPRPMEVENPDDPEGDPITVNPEGSIWTIVPFVRPAASDLNFTLAIALISVVMTQFYGMRAQGLSYWKKFFVWDGNAISKSPLAVMDPAVGLLEFISEVFKIVSFAFRLLGNIFAGMVLLFVIASLLPIANLAFYFLEFGVGALQALVFALLTLTFMSGATHSHH